MTEQAKKDFTHHAAAQRKMQAGVAFNLAIRAKLLVDKGIITEEEYAKAIADGMEEEVKLYGKPVTLGGTVEDVLPE